MVLTKLGPTVLDGLLSSKHHEILDLIDSLRSQGIDRMVDLPQIIVCGDQSSGKSSVLEAISGVPFPVKSNLCTRFPTELVLRKTPQAGVKISIIPHHSRSKSESDSLKNFDETLDDIEHLPRLIDAAKTAMGIVTLGTAFSRDILRIEVSGPDRPALTIVDLPGLIHSENKNQTAEDVKLINEVVQGYMRETRTIILSVVSAKNDYANQIVLKLARQADPHGSRTMGVITKPDTLLPGSDSESGYISLAKNEDIDFRLGWHVLRNTDSEAGTWSLVQRDALEAKFFSSGSWQRLPPTCLGIDNLRTRLSNALYYQIETELPSLIDDIKSKSMLYQEELLKLGNPRVTFDDQRLYLFQISQTFQNLAKSATDGTYNHEFFGDAMTVKGRQKRFRAVVQELGEGFSRKLHDKGHSHGVLLKHESSYGLVDQAAHNLLRNKVVKLMARTRGRELPGMFNPMVVTDLFQEMCSPWEDIAVSHMKEVFNAARVFLTQVFDHICDKPSAQAIISLIAEPKLDDILKHQHEKTMALLKPHQQGHPITYNQLLLQRVQEIRQERDEDVVSKVMARFYGSRWKTAGREYSHTDPLSLYNELTKARKVADAKNDVASKALDYVRVYYEISRERFIDDVSVQVVEECLVEELSKILEPIGILSMSQEIVSKIAGETEESRNNRKALGEKLVILSKGMETCRRYARAGVDDLVDGDFSDEQGSDELEAVSDPGSDINGKYEKGRNVDNKVPESESVVESETPAEPAAEAPVEYSDEAPAESTPEVTVEPTAEPATEPAANPYWSAWRMHAPIPSSMPEPEPAPDLEPKRSKKAKKLKKRSAEAPPEAPPEAAPEAAPEAVPSEAEEADKPYDY